MIIRCPHCEYARTVSATKIPPSAEVATCPKCKSRFRFRTLEPDEKPAPPPPEPPKEKAPADIWEAVDALARTLPPPPAPKVPPAPPEAAAFEPRRSRSEPKADPYARQGSLLRERFPRPEPETAQEHPLSPETVPPEPAAGTAEIEAPEIPVAPAEPEPAEPPSPPLPPAYTDGPVVFPYADDDTPPEERVARDMLLLQEEGERPTRDLGRIDEWSHDTDDDAGPETDVPWEHPEIHGKLGGFVGTVRRALLRPAAFFSGFAVSDALVPAYLFFIIQAYIALISTLLWRAAVSAILSEAALFAPTRLALPILLIIAPLVVGLMILFCAGVARTFLRVMAPERADFPGIFRIVCYSSSAFVFCVIPFLGPVVGWIWFGAALVSGFRHGLGLSWNIAALTALLPAVLLPGCMAAFFF